MLYYLYNAPRFVSLPDQPHEISPPLKENVEGLSQLTDLTQQGIAVLLIEMPPHPQGRILDAGSVESYEQLLNDAVLQGRGERRVPFWSTSQLVFTDDDYFDRMHFYISGSYKFSRWLGKQLGAAVNVGLLDGTLPDAVLDNPPLPALPLEEIKPPISEAVQHYYQQYADQLDLIPKDAILFNPAQGTLVDTDALLRLLLVMDYATDFTLDAAPAPQFIPLLDLASVLGQMRFEADLTPDQQAGIEYWRQSKDPRVLQEVGIDYLIYTDRWRSWLSDQDYAIVSDTTRYEPVGEWYHSITHETYFLYRLAE